MGRTHKIPVFAVWSQSFNHVFQPFSCIIIVFIPINNS